MAAPAEPERHRMTSVWDNRPNARHEETVVRREDRLIEYIDGVGKRRRCADAKSAPSGERRRYRPICGTVRQGKRNHASAIEGRAASTGSQPRAHQEIVDGKEGGEEHPRASFSSIQAAGLAIWPRLSGMSNGVPGRRQACTTAERSSSSGLRCVAAVLCHFVCKIRELATISGGACPCAEFAHACQRPSGTVTTIDYQNFSR